MNTVCDYIDELISEVKEREHLTPQEKDTAIDYLKRVYEWSFIHDMNNRPFI